jgi:uncharacterized protein (TIGR00106 family)
MLAELTLTPLGGDTHLSGPLAEVLRIIHASGLPYELTPMGTCIEGEWDEVMPLIRRCHEHMRAQAPHLVTTIRIEEDQGERNKLTRNVTSVEEKAGQQPLRRTG